MIKRRQQQRKTTIKTLTCLSVQQHRSGGQRCDNVRRHVRCNGCVHSALRFGYIMYKKDIESNSIRSSSIFHRRCGDAGFFSSSSSFSFWGDGRWGEGKRKKRGTRRKKVKKIGWLFESPARPELIVGCFVSCVFCLRSGSGSLCHPLRLLCIFWMLNLLCILQTYVLYM